MTLVPYLVKRMPQEHTDWGMINFMLLEKQDQKVPGPQPFLQPWKFSVKQIKLFWGKLMLKNIS